MFDIDNFPEFSSRRDGDPEGEGSLGKSNCCVRKESSQGRALILPDGGASLQYTAGRAPASESTHKHSPAEEPWQPVEPLRAHSTDP